MIPNLFQPLLNLFALRLHKGTPSPVRPPIARPLRDWSLLMWGVAGLALLLLLVAAALYAMSPWDTQSEPAAEAGTGLDAVTLHATLEHYMMRAQEHALLEHTPPPVTDPSR